MQMVSSSANSAELNFITIDVVSWAHLDKSSNQYEVIFPDLVR
jgi:hypothetical protein